MAHVLSPHRRELRRWLGVRRALVESRANLVTTCRGLAREQGVVLPQCKVAIFARKARRAGGNALAVLEPLLKQLDAINPELASAEAKLSELCETEPVVKLLMTAPGVGPIIAACFVSVIDDAKRFRSPHHVESYLGLVPSEDSSGGKRRLGAITKKGNPYLRSLLIEGSWGILRLSDHKEPLRVWAEAVAARRCRKVAVTALARRLVGVLWAMWRDSKSYDPKLLAAASSRGTRRLAHTLQLQAHNLEVQLQP